MTPKQIEKRLGEMGKIREDIETRCTGLQEAADELGQEIQAYMDERSEAWQEGEKGAAYSDLVTELGEFYAELPDVPELSV